MMSPEAAKLHNSKGATMRAGVWVWVDIGLVSSWVVTSSRQMPLTVIWDGMGCRW